MWALSQRIRTVADLPLLLDIIADRPPAPYQQIAERAAHLRDLGMSNRAIARSLRVSHWLVARAIAWFEGG